MIAKAEAFVGNDVSSDSDESLTESVIDRMYQEANNHKNAKVKKLYPVIDEKPTKQKVFKKDDKVKQKKDVN